MRTTVGMMTIGMLLAICTVMAGAAMGQSSSLLAAPRPVSPEVTGVPAPSPMMAPPPVAERGAMFSSVDPEDKVLPMTRGIEAASLFAIPSRQPRKFKVEDLVTIIVRQQRKYEADAELESKRKWNLSAKLSDWFRFYDDAYHLGQDKLSNGEPGAKFDLKNDYTTEGESDREDRFITRMTARVIDVKPNGNLVLEAEWEEEHDEEKARITITGVCRSEDVTPDNTVLSTQLADLRIVEKNSGAVRDAATRGWVPRLLNMGGGPF